MNDIYNDIYKLHLENAEKELKERMWNKILKTGAKFSVTIVKFD